MLLSQLIKKSALALLLSASLVGGLSASTCERRAFSIAITDTVTLNEILVQLSDVCSFSIVTRDVVAAETLNKELHGVNIKNMTLREAFNILINGNNLSYEFKNQTLAITALQTKTFKIDYITGVREGTAITKASTDSTPVEVDGSSDSDEIQDNIITTTERFHFWENLSNEITSILNNGTESYEAIPPIINQNAGLITVTATRSQLDRVQAYIDEMQRRLKRQVMLDVSIIEVRLDNEYTKGVDWSQFKLGFDTYLGGNADTPSRFTFGNRNEAVMIDNIGEPPVPSRDQAGNIIKDSYESYGVQPTFKWGRDMGIKASESSGVWAIGANLNFNIAGAINFLETKGKTKVISSPKVMTLNNQQALISVGSVINYILQESTTTQGREGTTQGDEQYSTFLGILLNITPEISDDNKIMLRINPSISDFRYALQEDRYMETRRKAPDALEKKISTVITVNDGDTVILGGMIETKKTKDNTNVPVLSEIPLVGGLFKSTADKLTTTELVFVITPRIVDNTSDMKLADSLKELGYSKSLYGY